jgi:hypothetical protein
VPADNTIDIDRDVVLGLDHLSWYTSQLDLYIYTISFGYFPSPFRRVVLTDNSNLLRADIDLDQSWVDRLVELTESGYQTDRSLL